MAARHLRRCAVGAALALAMLVAGPMVAAPTVFPTGTTIYQPDKTWNGFTVVSALGVPAVLVIDMDGHVVKRWDGFNLAPGGPARVLPGGFVIASQGTFPRHLETTALVAEDFAGKELWRFDHAEQITIDGKQQWSARQHHDWQRSDFPAGYYSPNYSPKPTGGTTLLLTHTTDTVPAIADVSLEDDVLIELDGRGNRVWSWKVSDHVDEFGYDARARAAIRRAGKREGFDWFHMNSASYVGPNKWFDAGDKRFDPRNVLISSRNSSVVAIVSRDTGHIVWRIGPDFSATPELAAIGQVIGQHHADFIPPGLPGAGDLMLFDNGGESGYGDPSPISPLGNSIYQRDHSRVLEIDPTTLKVVWQYQARNFYSTNISSAQRLPNGNTLIAEGAQGRIFEVTAKGDVVWEYMEAPGTTGPIKSNAVYRAYRIPYAWLPQVAPGTETPIVPPDPATFHVPGAPQG